MRTFALTLLLLTSACVHSDYIAVGDTTYPPRPKDWAIDVYVSSDAPVKVQKSIKNAHPVSSVPKSASVIGRVDTSSGDVGWATMLKSAKKKARALGGDGLVIGRWGSYLAGVGTWGEAYHGRTISMTVLRYRK